MIVDASSMRPGTAKWMEHSSFQLQALVMMDVACAVWSPDTQSFSIKHHDALLTHVLGTIGERRFQTKELLGRARRGLPSLWAGHSSGQ